MRTKRGRSVAFAAVVAAGLALVVSACGGGGGGGSSNATTSSTSGKTFPVLKVVNGTTDYLDPGLSYRLESWQLFQDTYLGLVDDRHGDGRRQGLQVHAAQRSEVLRRDADQSE